MGCLKSIFKMRPDKNFLRRQNAGERATKERFRLTILRALLAALTKLSLMLSLVCKTEPGCDGKFWDGLDVTKLVGVTSGKELTFGRVDQLPLTLREPLIYHGDFGDTVIEGAFCAGVESSNEPFVCTIEGLKCLLEGIYYFFGPCLQGATCME